MKAKPTDWDHYYDQPFKTSRFTRRYTCKVLRQLITRHALQPGGALGTVLEIGGANSCFYNDLCTAFDPAAYHVVDLNRKGLDLLLARTQGDPRVHVHQQDVLNMQMDVRADLVFSVGLIEHFDEEGTRRALAGHFAVCRPGGIVLITYPTPTWLYRGVRGVAEMAGVWAFPDERPLRLPEVLGGMEAFGEILHHRINWPVVLTQEVVVVRKHR